MSTLKVGTIQDHANSNTAITISSSGEVGQPQMTISMFGTSADASVSSGTAVIANWVSLNNSFSFKY